MSILDQLKQKQQGQQAQQNSQPPTGAFGQGQGSQPPMSAAGMMYGSSPFGGIGDAESSQGNPYVVAGVFLCSVERAKIVTSRKKDTLFCATLGVIESDVPDRRPGSQMDWLPNLTKQDSALGNVKDFIASAMGCPPSEVTEAVAETCVHESNPLEGRLIRLRATDVLTKAGTNFTRCQWSSVGEEDQAQSMEIRKALHFV